MKDPDIRWQQRFRNFEKAFLLLEEAVILNKERPLTDLEKQGLIQRFEFTHELAWKVIKDYFEYQGDSSITGSRDATREAFNKGLVENGEGWMDMLQSRNKSSHTYSQETADAIAEKIIHEYYDLFNMFKTKMGTMPT
ncbi:MAG: nucleotidyltransferase [Spirochaetae bacterium HGW-Spirochaetae-1]|nr:MAG: nucleotidyltransferase [Spirochaetae bacterium HGW-Spirochaetae-1]